METVLAIALSVAFFVVLPALLVWAGWRVLDNWAMWDYKETGYEKLYREKVEKRKRWRRFVRSGFRAPPEDE